MEKQRFSKWLLGLREKKWWSSMVVQIFFFGLGQLIFAS